MAARRMLALLVAAVAAACLVAAAPPTPTSSALAATQQSSLDKAHEAIAHPLLAAQQASAAPSPAAGSLHAATKKRAHSRAISPHNRAKAAAFVSHIENLITTMKHKAALHRLKGKYNSSQPFMHDMIEDDEEEEEEAGAQHYEMHRHGPTSQDGPATAAHLPETITSPSGVKHLRIPAHRHDYLPAVEPSEPTHDGHFSASSYVLHPIQMPPVSPSPSGLNFTTFVYPTVQGNVTIYVGVTEYPLGKFHFYPSPRDSPDQDISLIRIEHARRMREMNQRAQAERMAALARRRVGNSPMLRAFLELETQLNPLCDGVAETSVTSQSYGCLFAQNAGFFDMSNGACLGNVVSNGQLINRASASLAGHSHFGLTRKGNFITGYLTEEQVGRNELDGGFHELIQGSGWLIREGSSYINQSAVIEGLSAGFLAEKAPRNAIGHDRHGRLVMFEADGEEDIDLGLTLYEFADILSTHFDVQNAINVDGGGSSTTVYQDRVVDRPTCHDTPVLCERSVTTISCVMP